MSPPHPTVLFISPYSHRGAPSGARRRVEGLASAFVEMGVSVASMSPWSPHPAAQHLPFSLDGSYAQKLKSLARMQRIVWRLRPGLVLSESPLCPVRSGADLTLHVIHDGKFGTKFGRLHSRFARLAHFVSARLADRVLTVSHAERARLAALLHLPKDRIIVSPNGVSDMWTTPRAGQAEPTVADVLYVSNFARHKGHLNLIEALKGTDLSVAFVGADFGTLDACRAAAAEAGLPARFETGLSEDELVRLYDQCTVFAFPSQLEGFGMPYVEARARGLPVVANDLPIFHELQAKVGGAIVDFADARAARLAIQHAMVEPRMPADVSGFTWRAEAQALLALL